MRQFLHTYVVMLVASGVGILLWISVALHGGWEAVLPMIMSLGAVAVAIIVIAMIATGIRWLTR